MRQEATHQKPICVKPCKDIDLSMCDTLKEELNELVNEAGKDLTIDLDGVKNIDTAGLGLLVAARSSVTKAGGTFLVANASEKILYLFKSMGLEDHFLIG